MFKVYKSIFTDYNKALAYGWYLINNIGMKGIKIEEMK